MKILFFFIIFILFSCNSPNTEKKTFNFEKDIRIKPNDSLINKKEYRIDYDFSEDFKYKLKTYQYFISPYKKVLIEVSFIVNFQKEEDKYKVFFTDLSFNTDIYKGYFNVLPLKKKYELIINSLYFYIYLDNKGKKTFKTDVEIYSNTALRNNAMFLFNIMDFLIPEFKKDTKSNCFIEYKIYQANENDTQINNFKSEILKKINLSFENYKNHILFFGQKDNVSWNLLYSKKYNLPEKVNFLISGKEKIKFDDREYSYKVKNYYFLNLVK